jgi:enoyl-CoA hydratase/carnithine racemase
MGIKMTNLVLCHHWPLFDEIILNRREKLNALNAEMLKVIKDFLLARDQEKPLLISGKGEKAFCAGGDVREVSVSCFDNPKAAADFFDLEYSVDYLMYQQKNSFFLGQGIVMGGGLGLTAGVKNRYLFKDSTVAMPECTIGLFPDVGASHFLAKASLRDTAMAVGLFGLRLPSYGALQLGLTDFILNQPSASYESLLEEVRALHPRKWSAYLGELCEKEKKAYFSDEENYFFTKLFSGSLMDVARRIKDDSLSSSPLVQEARLQWEQSCPLSLAVTYYQFILGRKLKIEDNFRFEGKLAQWIATDFNFREGVRAKLIDKDHKPHWQPFELTEAFVQEIEKKVKMLINS